MCFQARLRQAKIKLEEEKSLSAWRGLVPVDPTCTKYDRRWSMAFEMVPVHFQVASDHLLKVPDQGKGKKLRFCQVNPTGNDPV